MFKAGQGKLLVKIHQDRPTDSGILRAATEREFDTQYISGEVYSVGSVTPNRYGYRRKIDINEGDIVYFKNDEKFYLTTLENQEELYVVNMNAVKGKKDGQTVEQLYNREEI